MARQYLDACEPLSDGGRVKSYKSMLEWLLSSKDFAFGDTVASHQAWCYAHEQKCPVISESLSPTLEQHEQPLRIAAAGNPCVAWSRI